MDNQNTLKQFLRAVFHELFRSKNKYNLLASIALLLLVAIGYFWKETYVSNATITVSARLLNHVNDGVKTDSERVQRLIDIAGSHMFAERIATSLMAFDPAAKKLDEESRVRRFVTRSNVTHVGSNIIVLSYRSERPEDALSTLQLTLNTLIATAMPVEKLNTLKREYDVILENEENLRQQLSNKKKQVRGLGLAVGNNSSKRVEVRIQSIRESLQDVKVNINAVTAKIKRIGDQLKKEEELQLSKQKLDELLKQQEKITSLLEKNKTIYSPTSSEVVSLQQELDRVNIKITSFTASSKLYTDGSKSLYEQLRAQESLAQVEIVSLQSRHDSLTQLLTRELEKVATEQKQNSEVVQLEHEYDLILAKYEEIKYSRNENLIMQRQLEKNLPNITVLEEPSLPQQYTGLGFVEFLIMGPIIAFMLPFSIASILVLTDSRIRTCNQLKNIIPPNIALLGIIPHHNSPETLRVFRETIIGLFAWGVFVFSVYATIGVIGLKD